MPEPRQALPASRETVTTLATGRGAPQRAGARSIDQVLSAVIGAYCTAGHPFDRKNTR